MSQYRIVKMKHYENSYKVQKKIMCFWVNTYWMYKSLNDCKWFIEDDVNTEKHKKDNPRDIVVKTF